MKLLLLQPPVRDFYDTAIRLQPIGLCYLKAAVQRHHPDVEVLVGDYHQGWGRKTISLPQELHYLKAFYPRPDAGPFSTFHQYYHFGAPFETIAEETAAARPDIVGISSLFSPYYKEVLHLASAIKKRFDVPIIVGGSNVSAAPEMMLRDRNIDFIVQGEGERPLVEFINAWKNGQGFDAVPNLGYKMDGEIVLNPVEENFPIQDLPAPDFSDLPVSRYQCHGKPLAFLVTSRGCPHRCDFCSVHQTFGRGFRRRTAESVVDEMKGRYNEGYRVFDFEDDNLTFDRERMWKLCALIMKEFKGREIELLAMNGVSHESLDEETLLLMRDAGFTRLNLSLVSTSDRVLDASDRPHRTERFLSVVQTAHDLGFQLLAHQIVGLPHDTLPNMIETTALLARLPLLMGVSIFYLTPGSPIAARFPPMTEKDIFLSRSTAMALETEAFRRDHLYTFLVAARILNFLKGLPVFRGESLWDALDSAARTDRRASVGAAILKGLFEGKGMRGWSKGRYFPLPQFREDLFFTIWEKTRWLRTTEGETFSLGPVGEGMNLRSGKAWGIMEPHAAEGVM